MTRLLGAYFPAFPLQVAMRARPEAKKAFAVADSVVEPGGRREAPLSAPLLAVSSGARKAGVRAGMTVTQGRAVCPDLVVRPLDPAAHEVARIAIGEVLSGFGPIAEVESAELHARDLTAWVDVTGERRSEESMAKKLGEELALAGFHVRCAAASNRFTARAVAAYAKRAVVPKGEEGDALADLPIAALRLDAHAAEVFPRLGVRVLGEIACLPADALARRFGAHAARYATLARGVDPSPLTPFRIPPVLFEKIDLPAPVVDSEPLLFALKMLLDRVSARLTGRGHAAAKVALHLVLDRGDEVAPWGSGGEAPGNHGGWTRALPAAVVDLRLPRPTVSVKTILEVARERLSRMPLPGPVVELAVEVVDAVPTRRTQLELFAKAPPAPERIAVTLGRLATAFGAESVFAAELTEEHRPERAFRAEPFPETLPKVPEEVPKPSDDLERPMRLLREPEPVQMLGGLREIVVRGQRLGVVALAGPERLSGEWWADPFDRDYYRVATEEGSRWWVYLDRPSASWHLHGLYD